MFIKSDVLKSPGNADENASMSTSDVKQQAHALIDSLEDTATWGEVAYHIEVRASIEQDLADVQAGRVYTTEELRNHFDLDD